ncbi:MAG: glycoside hydrolase family 97 catalytic domain-containing protein [Kiritimatiellae bacterium]|nr:glycoside hydrolase family 97 catalytic domain-containing protein [Kiritimatiellia bacterium]
MHIFATRLLPRNLLAALAIAAPFACQADLYSVKSPDGRNVVEVETLPRLSLRVFRDGCLRLGPVEPMMEFGGRPSGFAFSGCERRSLKGKATSPIYKKSHVDLSANCAVFRLGDSLAVNVTVRDDAAAYRFETSFDGMATVLSETADFVLPSADAEVWLANEWPNAEAKGDTFQNSWEAPHRKRRLEDVSPTNIVCLPLVVRFPDGQAMCVTESDLRGYPGWNLRGEEGATNRLSGAFARAPDPGALENDLTHVWVRGRLAHLAETEGRRTYPWRVFMFADSPARLCENDAVWALAREAEGDFSWVRPGVSAWNWWNDTVVRGVDFKPGMNTATMKHYVDFAAEMKLAYLVIDSGWCVKDELFRVVPALDLAEVCRHARERGVGIILWAGWGSLLPEGRDMRREVFERYSAMGAAGFKIDFIDRDDVEAERFVESTAALAAQCRLVIDYHGMHKPTGLSRTYPNVLTYEGVFGLEQVKWAAPGIDFAESDLAVFFCRMSAGPMDYTPGAMRNSVRKFYRPSYSTPESMTTRVHQMALFTLFESPLQMMCDSPTMYRENVECARFIAAVPTVWDETRGLAGELGKFAVVARRKGSDWWVAAIGPRQPFSVEVKLDFLGDGAEWEADVFEDGPLASSKDACDYRHGSLRVKPGEALKVKMAGGGGWCARFCSR